MSRCVETGEEEEEEFLVTDGSSQLIAGAHTATATDHRKETLPLVIYSQERLEKEEEIDTHTRVKRSLISG